MTKATEAAARLAGPPLTDVPAQLRTMADRWPQGDDSAVLLVIYPSGKVYGWGEALERATIVGQLTLAAHVMAAAD